MRHLANRTPNPESPSPLTLIVPKIIARIRRRRPNIAPLALEAEAVIALEDLPTVHDDLIRLGLSDALVSYKALVHGAKLAVQSAVQEARHKHRLPGSGKYKERDDS